MSLNSLTNVCRQNGFGWELQYSEVENLYYGMVTDPLAKIGIISEAKKASTWEWCVERLIKRLEELGYTEK